MKTPWAAAAMVLATLVLTACGGGGGGNGGGGNGGMMPGGGEIDFQAPAPPATSVSLQEGAVAGTEFEILVQVRDVNDFFGAAFRVTYDPDSVDFVTATSASSFLPATGVTTQITAETLSPGTLAVVATRVQNQAGTVPGVDVVGTRTLIRLVFEATDTTGGNPFQIAQPREVCSSDADAGGCDPITVTWQGGTLIVTEL